MTVKITYLSKTNYTIYNGVYSGQTLYVIYSNDKLFARYALSSAPETTDIINNLSFAWQINELLTIQSVNQLMDDILPYVEQLSGMCGTAWDGFRWVGEFTDQDKADEILAKIEEFIEVDNEELPHYDIVAPDYYSVVFANKTPAEMRSYVSGKKYLDDGILFSQDPYDFVNFAIGMNASCANEYLGALSELYAMYEEFSAGLDDVDVNNNINVKNILNAYEDAIVYFFDVIEEPDKVMYLSMLVYGNTFFETCMNVFDTDALLQNEEITAFAEQHIVNVDAYNTTALDVPKEEEEKEGDVEEDDVGGEKPETEESPGDDTEKTDMDWYFGGNGLSDDASGSNSVQTIENRF